MRFINDIRKYYKYVIYAGKAQLKAEVANSYLNWLWWVIEPLCFMLIYSFVFGTLFGTKKDYFAIYVFIGITMWDFFSRCLSNSVKVVRNNKAIVAKIYIPKYLLLMIRIYVNGFKMCINFVLLAGMLLVLRVPLSWNMLWIFPVVLTHIVLTFGVSAILLHFGVYVDDLANVVRIVLRMLMYLTGIFYDLKTMATRALGEHTANLIMNLNPLAGILEGARDCLLYQGHPSMWFLGVWFLAGLVLSMIGIGVIYRNENSYVKVI